MSRKLEVLNEVQPYWMSSLPGRRHSITNKVEPEKRAVASEKNTWAGKETGLMARRNALHETDFLNYLRRINSILEVERSCAHSSAIPGRKAAEDQAPAR